MSRIALLGPDFSRISSSGMRVHRNLIRTPASWITLSSNCHPTGKENKSNSEQITDIQLDRLQRTSRSGVGGSIEFGQFVAREAQLDEEYWTAAWLRAETHCGEQQKDRYADNHKRKFAEQEFNALKKRCKAQLGEKCTCIVAITMVNGVVGTLDLSIGHLAHGQNFPGERVEAPLFCLTDSKSSSRYGYIANLCVARSARRQGIARNMLHFAIISAKANGLEKVFVHVHRNNKPAQSLYRKIGFQVVHAASPQLSADKTYLLCFESSSYYTGHSFCI